MKKKINQFRKVKQLLKENKSFTSKEKKQLFNEYDLTEKQYKELLLEQEWDFYDSKEAMGIIQLWKINKSTGDCELSNEIEPFYICLDSYAVEDNEDLNSSTFDWFDEYVINDSHAHCCDPMVLPDGGGSEEVYEDPSGLNTINNFVFFLNGGCGNIDNDVDVNYLMDPSIEGDAGNFDFYFSNECPSCLPDQFPGAPYDTPPNVVDGNNFPNLPSNGGLEQLIYVQDGSCIVEACNQKYWDNYFCTEYPLLCGFGSNTCNGNCATWDADLIEDVEDDNSCYYYGCIDVPVYSNYVCTLWPDLCPGTSAMSNEDALFQYQFDGDEANPTPNYGIPGGYYSETYIGNTESLAEWSESNVNGTFENDPNACTQVLGCTSNIFTNYNQDADGNTSINNVDDGSCYWEGCAEPKLAYLPQYVCNQTSLCDASTESGYIEEYGDGLGTGLYYTPTAGDGFIVDDDISCPLIEGCTNPNFIESYNPDANWDDGSCVYIGCLDNTKPNYICNDAPALCNQEGPDGVPLQTYTGYTSEGNNNEIPSDIYLYIDNPNELGPLVLSNPDACGDFGCMDNGEMGEEWWDANYAGQDNGGLGALPDDYPGFQPGNYNPLATVDNGTCNYNLNGTTVFDFNDIEGCVASQVAVGTDGDGISTGFYTPNLNGNVPEGATLDNNTCEPIIFGCTDNGNMGQEWWDATPNNPYGPLDGTNQFNWQYTGLGPIYQNTQAYSSISYLPDLYPEVPTCISLGIGSQVGGDNEPEGQAVFDADITQTLGEQKRLLKEQEAPLLGQECVDNYNPLATVDDGSCVYYLAVMGCASDDPSVTMDISWFTTGDDYDWDTNPCNHVMGCTDPEATLGYNADADVDDGSCVYEVEGCMEPSADNYNTIANIEDGSCVWNSEGAACVQVEGGCCGQPYADNQTQLGVDIPLTDGSIYALANNGYMVGPDSMIGNMSQTLDAMVGLVYVGTTLGSDHVTNGFDSEYCIFSGFCTDPNDQDEYMCDDNNNVFLCSGFDSDNVVPNTDLGQFIDSNCTSDPVPGCMDPNANGPAGPAPYGPYNPFATTDDVNALGNTYCTYSYCGHNPEQANWNAPLNFGELNPDASPNFSNIVQWFPGTEFNKPQYQVNAGGPIYGGGTWTDDDNRNSSLCRYEGCANLAGYQTVTVNGVDYNYSSDIPGEELGGLGNNIVNDFGEPLYTYNAQNDGCDPQGDGTPDINDFSCCAIPGCTDPTGTSNYNLNATVSTTGGNAPSGTPQYNNGCNYLLGCTDSTMENYNPDATMDDGSCFSYGCTTEAAGDNFADNYWCIENDCDPDVPDYVIDGGPNAVYTHPITNNATNCIFYGCMDSGYTNYDPYANVDDAGCAEEIVYGCTIDGMFNFDPLANVDDGSCEEVVYGCMNYQACNYNSLANTNSGCTYPPPADDDCNEYNCAGICVDVVIQNVYGCMDNTACNYNPQATVENYTCWYPEVGYDCDGDCLSGDTDEDGICDDNEEFGYEEDPTNGEACYDVIAYRCDDPNQVEKEFKCMRIASNTGGNGESIYYYDPLIYTPDSDIVKEFMAPDIDEDIDYSYNGECQWCPGFSWTDQNTGITREFDGYWFPIGIENEDLETYNMLTPLGPTDQDGSTNLGNIQNFANQALCQNYQIDAFLTGWNPVDGYDDVFDYVWYQLDSWADACENAGYSGIGNPAFTTWGDDWYNWPGGVNFYYEYTEGEVVVADNCPPTITGVYTTPDLGQGGQDEGWVHTISDIINPNTGCQTSTMGSFPGDWNCNYWNTTDNWDDTSEMTWYPVPETYNGQASYIEVPPNTSVMVMNDYPTYQGLSPFGPVIQGPAAVCFSGTVNCTGCTDCCNDNDYGIPNNWVSTFVVNPSLNSQVGMPVPGCTDETASNYNPDANEDDGSCIYDTEDMPEAACGGEPGSWQYPDLCGICNGGSNQCMGCTDPNASNYDGNALLDCQFDTNTLSQIDSIHFHHESIGGLNPYFMDEDIEYPMWTQPYFSHINNQIGNDIISGNTCCEYVDDTVDDGLPEWINPSVVNVAQHCVGDPNFPGDNWEFPITTTQDEDGVLDLGPGMANEISYVWIPAGLTARFYTVPQTNTSFPGEAPLELVGPQEINCLVDLGYNDTIQAVSVFETGEDINVGDVEGCTDPDYLEYDPAATVDDGSCTILVIEGCTNQDALNYDQEANTACNGDNSCCEFADPNEFNPDTQYWVYKAGATQACVSQNEDASFANVTAEDVSEISWSTIDYPWTPQDYAYQNSNFQWPQCAGSCILFQNILDCCYTRKNWVETIPEGNPSYEPSRNGFNNGACATAVGPIE